MAELYKSIDELHSVKNLMNTLDGIGDPIEPFALNIIRHLVNAAMMKLDYFQRKYKFEVDSEDYEYTENFVDFMKNIHGDNGK